MPAPKFPVSVKGVIFLDRRVVLLRNGRGEWALPGGRLEAGENPADCLAREIGEELAIEVAVESLLDCWRYEIQGQGEVVIVTYGCRAKGEAKIQISPEHHAVGQFGMDELVALDMPEGYKQSIRTWDRLAQG